VTAVTPLEAIAGAATVATPNNDAAEATPMSKILFMWDPFLCLVP
jgi:hypothetical protein